MSIIRVGLAETRNFSEGYDLIFGKNPAANPPGKRPTAKQTSTKKKVDKKKKKKSVK